MNQPRIELITKLMHQANFIMRSVREDNTVYQIKELTALVYEILDALLKNEI